MFRFCDNLQSVIIQKSRMSWLLPGRYLLVIYYYYYYYCIIIVINLVAFVVRLNGQPRPC